LSIGGGSDRKSGRDPGDPDAERLDEAREVQRRGLALDVGVGRDQDLGDLVAGEAVDEFTDAQALGADAVDG